MLDLLLIAVAALTIAAVLISRQLKRISRHMSQATDALAAALAGLTTSALDARLHQN